MGGMHPPRQGGSQSHKRCGRFSSSLTLAPRMLPPLGSPIDIAHLHGLTLRPQNHTKKKIKTCMVKPIGIGFKLIGWITLNSEIGKIGVENSLNAGGSSIKRNRRKPCLLEGKT